MMVNNSFDLETAFLKWKGRVTNNDDELKQILNTLQREPKNACELSDLILKSRNEQMSEILSEANKGLSKKSNLNNFRS